MTDLNDPFAHHYVDSWSWSLHTARQSITSAIQALAETGQIRIWLLREKVLLEEDSLSGIYASLEGAILGAQMIIADELITYDEDQPFNQNSSRMNYVNYLIDDITWEYDYPEVMRQSLGLYNFTTTEPNGHQRHWLCDWHELMP